MARSAAAVIAGLMVAVVIVVVITFVADLLLGLPRELPPTPAYLAFSLVGSAVAGASGGAIAVRIAPHTPHGHVVALALVVLLLSLPTIFSAPAPGQPGWYALALSAVGPASVLAGGIAAARWRATRR